MMIGSCRVLFLLATQLAAPWLFTDPAIYVVATWNIIPPASRCHLNTVLPVAIIVRLPCTPLAAYGNITNKQMAELISSSEIDS